MSVRRILLVEDQAESAAVFRAGIESLGADFEVTAVSSAEAALKALEKHSFDLLMADVMLPGISGMELMARFRRKNPETKVILVSGVPDPELRRQIARSGAEAFFFKPVELSDLLDCIERLFGLAKSFLPSELSVIQEEPTKPNKSAKVIADQLAELRFNLQALSVALVSERGQILARAGTLPDPQLETTLMPHLMSAFFAAGRIAAFTNSSAADDLLAFRGKDYHLHMSSLSPSYALLVATKPLNPARAAALSEAVQKAITRVLPELNTLEKATQPEETANPKSKDLSDTDPHLEKLLVQAETRPMSRSQTDKYWKTKEKVMQTAPRSGTLSYEQAAQIGLAPSGK
jgi:CheY-like chemotaxis protein